MTDLNVVRRTEAQLVAALASEEAATAAAELYRLYGSRLYTLGLRLLGDAELAEELVQETFVRLQRDAAAFEAAEGAPLRGWVLAHAREVAVELHRRAGERTADAEPVLGAGGEVYDPLDDIPPVDALERALRGLDVREAIAALTPTQREVLQLGYDQELSQREIAERLSVPLETVKTRTYDAVHALGQELRRRGLL